MITSKKPGINFPSYSLLDLGFNGAFRIIGFMLIVMLQFHLNLIK